MLHSIVVFYPKGSWSTRILQFHASIQLFLQFTADFSIMYNLTIDLIFLYSTKQYILSIFINWNQIFILHAYEGVMQIRFKSCSWEILS